MPSITPPSHVTPPSHIARRVLFTAASTLACAGLLFWGSGTSPHAWATWLAPLPVLAASLRSGWRVAAGSAFAAWLLATTNQWAYLHHQLEMPLPLVAAFTVGPALLFAAAVSLFRLLAQRSVLGAAIGFPAAWAGLEYVVSLVTPHGAYWSLAYTQLDIPFVRHLAAATGPWGITFLVMAVPASLAAATAVGLTRRLRIAPTAVALVAICLAAAYSGYSVRAAEPTVRVGLLAVPQREDPVGVATTEGQRILSSYVDGIRLLTGQRAAVVVLPEKVFAVDTASLPMVVDPLARLASTYRITIVVGLLLAGPDATSNIALAITGKDVMRYDKHHLIPGIEDDFRPGTGLTYVDGYAVTVCKDMDFPALMRQVGGTGLVLAPAWDFGSDGWLHSRMAILRGVEDGFSVVRTARNGALTASDATGRVRAEVSAEVGAGGIAMLVADLPTTPVTTPYERWGDWFGWLCLAIMGTLVGLRLLPGRRRIDGR